MQPIELEILFHTDETKQASDKYMSKTFVSAPVTVGP